jgi:hypothetical protein
MSDDEPRDTLPPGAADDECHDFETQVREHGEHEARLDRLKFLAALDARDEYLRRIKGRAT